jgi:CHASE1-domain containing sensor protein
MSVQLSNKHLVSVSSGGPTEEDTSAFEGKDVKTSNGFDLEMPRSSGTATISTATTIKQVNFTPGQLQNEKTRGDAILPSSQKKEDDDGSVQSAGFNTTDSMMSLSRMVRASTMKVTIFILVMGMTISGAFLGLGISSAVKAQDEAFDRNAADLLSKIQQAWADYVNAAAVIHGECRQRAFTRNEFRILYEYLTGGGLDFQAAQFDPNITHAERDYYEQEARDFYAEKYPHVVYRGFIGFNYDGSTSLDPRNESDFYFPIHYMEPVVGNERALGLDYHASGSRKRTVLHCMNTGTPAITDRLKLVQETVKSAFGVVLMHPGYPLTNLSVTNDTWPRDLASIVIRIPDLLQRATKNQQRSSAVYLFDKSDSENQTIFLGGVKITNAHVGKEYTSAELEFLAERELEDLRRDSKGYYHEMDVQIANKVWTISVMAVDGTFKPDVALVIVGGIIFLLATIGLAYWVHENTYRVARINRLKSEAEAERATLILEGARKAAEAERELNDFIAHEVSLQLLLILLWCG